MRRRCGKVGRMTFGMAFLAYADTVGQSEINSGLDNPPSLPGTTMGLR